MSVRFRVADGCSGRADKIVAAKFPNVGRKHIAELFRQGAVRIDGALARKGDQVVAGSEIELNREPEAHVDTPPTPCTQVTIDVLYADEHLVAIDKPGGVPSHPLRADERHTAANALVAQYPECAAASPHAREAGLAHRLDIGTSGVLLAARHRQSWQRLRRAFTNQQIRKRYWALVNPPADRSHHDRPLDDGRCDATLSRRGARMCIARPQARDDAQTASTTWRVLHRYPGAYALVECIATTGRMHQVRLHLAHALAPIVGDTLYGGTVAPRSIAGFFLHARRIELTHPMTGERLDIEAPLPTDRDELLGFLS